MGRLLYLANIRLCPIFVRNVEKTRIMRTGKCPLERAHPVCTVHSECPEFTVMLLFEIKKPSCRQAVVFSKSSKITIGPLDVILNATETNTQQWKLTTFGHWMLRNQQITGVWTSIRNYAKVEICDQFTGHNRVSLVPHFFFSKFHLHYPQTVLFNTLCK